MTNAAPAVHDLLGSVSHHAASDDRLKDADNLSFLAGQPAEVRRAWLERCEVLRSLDRLVEAARADRDDRRLARLREAWHVLWTEDRVLPYEDVAREFEAARALWLTPPDSLSVVIGAGSLDAYLEAVCEYSRAGVELATVWEHDRMLFRISGSMFRLFPFVGPRLVQSIGHFGALDHAYNNLRDLAEDADAGLCFFPQDVLDRVGVSRWRVLSGAAIGSPAFRALMTWWLDEHLPAIRARARAFIDAADLHPSLAALRAACLRRYERVERTLRVLSFDYRAFPVAYRAEVLRELGAQALGIKEIAT